MLYVIDSDLSDNQFLYIDLFNIIPLIYLMTQSGPIPEICKEKPPKRLISFEIIFSVLGQTLIQALFQIGIYISIINQ